MKRARDAFCPFDEPAGGRQQAHIDTPFQHFSESRVTLQPFFKARRIYNGQHVRLDAFSQGFPYDPEPPDMQINSYGLGLAITDTVNNNLGSGSSSCPFSIFRPDTLLSGLKVELPSVQLAESADSAGTPNSCLSSPFTSCYTMPGHPLSEADSFGSANEAQNNSNNCDNGLLEELLHQSGSSLQAIPPLPSSDIAEQLLVITSSNNSSPRMPTVNANSLPYMTKSDPLSFLGGRSLTLLSDEFKDALVKSTTSNACEDSSPSLQFQEGNYDVNPPAQKCLFLRLQGVAYLCLYFSCLNDK